MSTAPATERRSASTASPRPQACDPRQSAARAPRERRGVAADSDSSTLPRHDVLAQAHRALLLPPRRGRPGARPIPRAHPTSDEPLRLRSEARTAIRLALGRSTESRDAEVERSACSPAEGEVSRARRASSRRRGMRWGTVGQCVSGDDILRLGASRGRPRRGGDQRVARRLQGLRADRTVPVRSGRKDA